MRGHAHRIACAAVLGATVWLGGCAPPRPEIPAEPRVVSLAPNLTEMVCALHAAGRLVGRTSACDYPADALAGVPVVGGFGAPSLEQLVAVRPTLVLEADLADETLAREMERLGLRRVRIPCRTLEDIPKAVLAVGRCVHREREATALAAALTNGLAGLSAAAAAQTNRPTVFAQIWDDPLMTAGAGTFLSQVIALAGGRNLGDESARPYYQVSAEWVLARNPDVILCFDMEANGHSRRRVLERPGWAGMTAVRTGRVVDRLNADVILRPGPRVLEGVSEVRRAIGTGK